MSEHTATAETQPAHGHEHDEHAHHGSLFEHAKPYILVGAFLFVATGVTVALSYIDFADHDIFRRMFAVIGVSGMGINILVGLMLATCKVCAVGWWFMHLSKEKSSVWRPLFFTFFFVTGLFLLFLLGYSDPIPTTSHPLH